MEECPDKSVSDKTVPNKYQNNCKHNLQAINKLRILSIIAPFDTFHDCAYYVKLNRIKFALLWQLAELENKARRLSHLSR